MNTLYLVNFDDKELAKGKVIVNTCSDSYYNVPIIDCDFLIFFISFSRFDKIFS